MKKNQTRGKYNTLSKTPNLQALIAAILNKLASQPTVTNNYTFMKGSQKVDHIDSQSNTFYNQRPDDPVEHQPAGEEPVTATDDVLIAELAPIFFGNGEEAAAFLTKIRGAKPMQVVRVVRDLIKARKISDMSCGGTLWQILHDYNLYPCTLSNWYNLIKI